MKIWKNEDKEAISAQSERAHRMCWYVLLYDTKTTEYHNKIVFKYLKDANKEYERIEPTDDYRVELMFSPEYNDKDYSDNILIKYKEK